MCRFTRQPASRDNVKRNHPFHMWKRLPASRDERMCARTLDVYASGSVTLALSAGIEKMLT